MNIKVSSLTKSKKGNTVIVGSDGKNYYIDKKAEGFTPHVGTEYNVDVENKPYNGKDYHWIVKVNEAASVPKPSSTYGSKTPADVRSFAISYAKDLVVAKAIEYRTMYIEARDIEKYINTGELPVPFGEETL